MIHKVWYCKVAKAEDIEYNVVPTCQRRSLPSTAKRWRWRPHCPSLVSAAVFAPAGRSDPLWRPNPSHSASTHLQEARRWKRGRGGREEKERKINGLSCWYSSVVFIQNAAFLEGKCLHCIIKKQYMVFDPPVVAVWSEYKHCLSYKQPGVQIPMLIISEM